MGKKKQCWNFTMHCDVIKHKDSKEKMWVLALTLIFLRVVI